MRQVNQLVVILYLVAKDLEHLLKSFVVLQAKQNPLQSSSYLKRSDIQ